MWASIRFATWVWRNMKKTTNIFKTRRKFFGKLGKKKHSPRQGRYFHGHGIPMTHLWKEPWRPNTNQQTEGQISPFSPLVLHPRWERSIIFERIREPLRWLHLGGRDQTRLVVSLRLTAWGPLELESFFFPSVLNEGFRERLGIARKCPEWFVPTLCSYRGWKWPRITEVRKRRK